MMNAAQPLSFSARGFWVESIESTTRRTRSLQGDHRYDAVVIGGGFTGLSSAIALRERGLSVALLERDRIGSGASGKNCGQVGIQLGINPHLTLRFLGRERTTQYAATLAAAISNVTTMVERSGQDCDYLQVGNLTTGVHEAQRKTVERIYQACADVGLPVKMLDTGELATMGIPRFVKNAFLEQIGGTIHPAKYAFALAAIASNLGVDIFEDSPVQRIVEGDPVRAECANGCVTAPLCVMATDSYTAEMGLFRRAYMPYSVSALVTQKLTAEQRGRLGWRGQEGLHTPHKVIENIRLTPDGRVLIGTKRARLAFGNRHPKANDGRVFAALTRVLRERLPEISDVGPATGWTGHIGLASDGIPFFSTVNGRRNIAFGGGYGGHGIAMASYAGNILAKMLLEEDVAAFDVFIKRKRPPLPPEPLRWLLGQSLGLALGVVDDRVDRLARCDPV
jgi:gamma-glutamylputrescine oxidase